MVERWQNILGFKGYYAASTYGRVSSLERIIVMPNGSTRRLLTKLLKPSPGGGVVGRRYMMVSLSKDSMVQTHYVHNLVWSAFNGEVPNGLEVNHKDGDKTNNRLENLEVGTRKQNMEHALRLGLTRVGLRGSDCYGAVLNEEKVRKIKRWLAQGLSQTWIAKEMGVCKQTITFIKQGVTWQHVK